MISGAAGETCRAVTNLGLVPLVILPMPIALSVYYGCNACCTFHESLPRLLGADAPSNEAVHMPKVILLGATGGEGTAGPCDPWLCIPLTCI